MSIHTLEEFFQRHQNKAVDYSLRVETQNGKFRFYIHPQNVNGETWDFELEGNQLKCISVPSTLEE